MSYSFFFHFSSNLALCKQKLSETVETEKFKTARKNKKEQEPRTNSKINTLKTAWAACLFMNSSCLELPGQYFFSKVTAK